MNYEAPYITYDDELEHVIDEIEGRFDHEWDTIHEVVDLLHANGFKVVKAPREEPVKPADFSGWKTFGFLVDKAIMAAMLGVSPEDLGKAAEECTPISELIGRSERLVSPKEENATIDVDNAPKLADCEYRHPDLRTCKECDGDLCWPEVD